MRIRLEVMDIKDPTCSLEGTYERLLSCKVPKEIGKKTVT